MRREATALTRLQDAVDPALLAYFPPLVATGQRDDARSGIRRHVNLIGTLSGFRSLADVRTAFPAGVDPRTRRGCGGACWSRSAPRTGPG